jgi:hypothetical protein
MNEYDRSGVPPQSLLHDFTRMHGRTVYGATKEFDEFYQAMPAVKEQATESFEIPVAKLEHQIVPSRLRR